MACNRETSTDGSTSSASPVCPSPAGTAGVPCCNSNCRLLGCAATMNFCSKCYSEHLLKEGTGTFLDKACDTSIETQTDRSQEPGADEADTPHLICADFCNQEIVGVSSGCDDQIRRSKERSSLRSTKTMRVSQSASDLTAVFGLADISASSLVDMADMSADASDPPYQQPIPSPLSLPPPYQRPASPLQARQGESKLSLPTQAPTPRPQATNRCLTCRKRVGLLGFKCRCGHIYCATHRYSDKHDCSFDYKSAGRAAIARENPVVRASKIDRI